MSPLFMLATFVAIFASIFGLMVLVMRLMSRGQTLVVADGVTTSPRVQSGPEAPVTEKMAAFALRLKRAGIDLEPAQYRTRVLRITILVMLVGFFMGGMSPGGVIFSLILGGATFKGGDFFIDFKHGQRMAEFGDQFSDALGVMANGAKSGQTVLQTLESVSQDFDDPLRSEVEEVLSELRLGVPLDEALEHWVVRMPGEDLEIACTAIAVQRQTGGNVAEILETVALTIRERNKLFKQIRALTAQGRMSGWVMAMLPVGMFIAMYLIAPARTGLLISHPIGLGLTGLGISAILTGGYFIKKIVTIEV
jgi:tight adherence protein B